MTEVILRPSASADVENAFLWYERQRQGLGTEFLAALRATVERVVLHPDAFPVLHRDTRRALIPRRFPYGL